MLLLELQDVVGRLGLLLLLLVLLATEWQHLTPHRRPFRLDHRGLRGQLLLRSLN